MDFPCHFIHKLKYHISKCIHFQCKRTCHKKGAEENTIATMKQKYKENSLTTNIKQMNPQLNDNEFSDIC